MRVSIRFHSGRGEMSIERSPTFLRLRSKERSDSRVVKVQLSSAPSNGAKCEVARWSINISLLTEFKRGDFQEGIITVVHFRADSQVTPMYSRDGRWRYRASLGD